VLYGVQRFLVVHDGYVMTIAQLGEVGDPTLPYEPLIELVGVFAFALSGGFAAVRKNFDVIGVFVLAWCAGLGGGVLRDVLIGAVPPVGITDYQLFGTAALAGLITMLFHPAMARIWPLIVILDAVGLGLFAVQGAVKALDLESGFLAAAIVGVLTGVGGGVLRDLLSGDIPVIFREREYYAIPAVLGAIATVVLWYFGLISPWTTTAVAFGVVLLRLVALRFRFQAPGARTRPFR